MVVIRPVRSAFVTACLLLSLVLGACSDDPCVRSLGDRSIARHWNETVLDQIRIDLPNPPVHSRNLWHLSAAMYDAWAAYDDTADGYYFTE